MRRAAAPLQPHVPKVQDPTEVARGLDHIAALLDFAGAPKFKVRAYERAAEVTRTLGRELAPYIEQNRLRELSGIGPTLARQLEELWNTGTSEYLQRLEREHPEGAAELLQIQGMTPRRIRTLGDALGIRSIDELHAACADGRVRTVRGFGAKTEERLLAACERFREPAESSPKRVTLARALELAAFMQRELEAVVSESHIRILGHRAPIECDVPRVLDALAASGGAVKLNANPHRLDLPPAWIPAARERNLPFVISVDAHSTRGFEVLRYGITQARRGGLTRREILNAAPAASFAAAVRPVR